jgi:hypothetical protein
MAADPYKSRLFNLINRRLIRLKDNLGRASRCGQNANRSCPANSPLSRLFTDTIAADDS